MPEQRDMSDSSGISGMLKNSDFRKIMMTPRAGSSSNFSTLIPTPITSVSNKKKKHKVLYSLESSDKRREKKSYYAKLKKQGDDKMAELAAKYRDRAAERRDGGPPERVIQDTEALVGSGYRAVGPEGKSSTDAAERRRVLIQESKFLGGDMEHTHLVKGLDFALLQKVRSEIFSRESESQKNEGKENVEDIPEDEEEETSKEELPPCDPLTSLISSCKSNMAKNIIRTFFKPDLPDKNEFFMPGRMAYIIDLEEEFGAESDIPTTTIRSKADIMGNLSQQMTLTTNEIVINKLTQILSYLRAGSRKKKKKTEKSVVKIENKDEEIVKKENDIPIYDDIESYTPKKERRKDERSRSKDIRHKESRWDERSKSRNYFSKEDGREGTGGRSESRKTDKDNGAFSNKDKELLKNLMKRERNKGSENETSKMFSAKEPEGYAECYPGLVEMNDAIDDSDDEVDYTKMDLGNKKGPVGRWDFDTAEEYADYMGRKEALPKAAFQYGVKMTEGRKTRGKVGSNTEKAKLDKEWNKISAIIDKRKSNSKPTNASKKPKYDD